MKRQILLLTILLSYFSLFAEDNKQEISTLLYKAYINENESIWNKTLFMIENSADCTPINKVEAYFLYSDYLTRTNNKGIATIYVEKGVNICKNNPNDATFTAFLASFGTISIIIDKSNIITKGKVNKKNTLKAYSLNNKDIMANIQMAKMYTHTPRLFGGDIKKATTFLLNAVNLMEQNNQTDSNWLYMYSQVLLAQNYKIRKNPNKALEILKKVLSIEEHFILASNEMASLLQEYPELN